MTVTLPYRPHRQRLPSPHLEQHHHRQQRPPARAGAVEVFARCSYLNAVYPGGVARVGVQGNMVSGELRPFGRQPVFDDALYQANSARDGDGIACEQ